MKFDNAWNTRPEEGTEYIYRYYDAEGKSYIGHTKQSLSARAGGKKGSAYLRYDDKFSEAIRNLGFDKFEYEILDIVDSNIAEKKEIKYISQFNSKNDGYNSTYGGKAYFGQQRPYSHIWTIDINSFNEHEKATIFNNLLIYCNKKEQYSSLNDAVIELANNFACTFYTYPSYDDYTVPCHPIVLFFNFVSVMACQRYSSRYEIEEEMFLSGVLGGDILTGGYDALKIQLTNGQTLTIEI